MKMNNYTGKQEWEEESESYNNIFEFLEEKGLTENDLVHVAELLKIYIGKQR